MKLADFLQDVGRPVAYFPSLTPITGGATSTLFLCQLIYWTGKGRNGEGWIYKTQEEITRETGLTRREQETARKNLKRRGLLEEHYARLDHQMFYRVQQEVLSSLWELTFPNGGNVHSGVAENAIREETNPPFDPLSETTSETTPTVPPNATALEGQHTGKTPVDQDNKENGNGVRGVLLAVEDRQGYQIANYGKEGAAVKKALHMGYSAEQVVGCWEKMKTFSFWQGKPLSLATVLENLGEFAAGRLREHGRAGRAPVQRVEARTDPNDFDPSEPW